MLQRLRLLRLLRYDFQLPACTSGEPAARHRQGGPALPNRAAMERTMPHPRRPVPRRSLACAAFHCTMLTAVVGTGAARAFPIDTGDPDLTLRWDNSLRYNLGVRAQRQDQNILNNSS